MMRKADRLELSSRLNLQLDILNYQNMKTKSAIPRVPGVSALLLDYELCVMRTISAFVIVVFMIILTFT